MKNNLKAGVVNAALIAMTAAAAIAIGSQVPKILDRWHGDVKNGDYALHVSNQPQRLTLYGTTTCPHCIRARQFLARSGIPFNDLILDSSPATQKMFASLHEDGVPVLVSRTGLVRGFNPAAFAELAKASSQQ